MNFLMSQPTRRNSTASQSSSSGCEGASPCEPKSSDVFDEAVAEGFLPEAVDGDAGRQRFSSFTSHSRRPSRLRG